MNHLTVPVYCALVAGFCLALLLRALQTGAHSFTLLAVVGLLFFGWRAIAEARNNWPAFRKEMRLRTELRRREAQQKRCRYTDTH